MNNYYRTKLIKKKLTITNEKIYNKNIDAFEDILFYSSTVILKSGQGVEVYCEIKRDDSKIVRNICIKIKDESSSILIAKIVKKTNIVRFELIEIPEKLRNCGLGTYIMSVFILILEKISILDDIQLQQIQGTISDSGNFTPKISKRLYKKFHKYPLLDKQLFLDKNEFRKSKLVYEIK